MGQEWESEEMRKNFSTAEHKQSDNAEIWFLPLTKLND